MSHKLYVHLKRLQRSNEVQACDTVCKIFSKCADNEVADWLCRHDPYGDCNVSQIGFLPGWPPIVRSVIYGWWHVDSIIRRCTTLACHHFRVFKWRKKHHYLYRVRHLLILLDNSVSCCGLLHINLFYFPIKIFPMKIYNICTFQEKAELIWTDLFLKRECHRWDHHH